MWIAGLLILCSLLIYGMVMIFLPQSYTVVASSRVEKEIEQLIDTLSQTDYDDAGDVIEQFCQSNRASVILNDGINMHTFGTVDEQSVERGEVMTTAVDVELADRDGSYYLSITAPVSAGNELTMAFLELLPLILLLILIISALGAFLCSRVLVRPVLEISRVSKRMANLDMTWDCKVNRTDELGVLANSLNTMAKRLDIAMKELGSANEQLRKDMEHITELSRQRRDFFAAASHELKTPITILKGQIESMILGIGKYKDTGKVLPETLREVENMERLVKEILTISKIEMDGLAGKAEPVPLPDTLAKVTETLLPLAQERQITVHPQLAGDVTVSGNALSAGKGHSQYPEQRHPSLAGGRGGLYPSHAFFPDRNQYRRFYPGGRSARAVHAFLPCGKIPEQIYRRQRPGAVPCKDDSGASWISVSAK